MPFVSRHTPRLAALASFALAAGASFGVRPGAAQSTDTLRLSVEDAVTRALRSSDEAQLALARVEVADAQLTVARASGLPQLRLNTTYTRAFKNARATAVGQLFNQPNTYNVNLNLSQTVFQGGRIAAASRAASAVREASRLDAQEVRAVVALDVQRAYLNALVAERVAVIQEENLALASARVTQVQQLQAAGRVARYDLLRARVERANLEPLVIQARSDQELALLELKRVLNIPAERPLVLTSTLDPDATTALLTSLDDTVATPQRASVRAAELEVRARQQGVRIARADLLPSVAVSLQNGYQAFPPPGAGFPSRFGEASPTFCPEPNATRACQNGGWFEDRALAVTLSWPVFDGFRTKANVDLAQAQQRLAELELQQTREAVTIEVARARAELRRVRALFQAQQQNAAEAREAFDLATLRFARGLSTQLEVSDAQVALLTAQTNQARTTYDLYLAGAELARALGRPVPLPPTTPRTQPIRTSSGNAGVRP
ncbi:MAG: TolC family protein [Gemmatimonadota bacterium]|nr:TolC family protein [Gemmatimonadota bacterium]